MEQKHKITKQMFIGTMIVMIVAELSGAFTAGVDGLITSRYLGPDLMSAQGIGTSYFVVVSIISGILMVGCQTLVVEAISKGKKEKARSILTMASYVGVVLTLLLTLFMWMFPNDVAILFGASSSDITSIENVGQYLKGISIGASFWLMFVLLTPIVQLDGGGKICSLASIVMCVVDVGLDYLFGVLLKMGLFGMGLASAISHIVSGIIMIAFMFTRKCTIKFNFKKPDFKSFGKVVKNGLPRAISMISRTVGPILLNIIVLNTATGLSIAETSNIGMAALAIQRSLSLSARSIGWGIGGALLMIGTLYYNERNLTELKITLRITMRNIILLVASLGVVLFFLAPLISKFYIPNWISNKYLYETTNIALKYYFLSIPFVAFNVCFANYMQITGKTILCNILNACVECVALVIPCYLLSIKGGYNGFFLGFFVGEASLALVCGMVFIINYFTSKNKNKKLFLPQDFIKDGLFIIEKTITSIEDALNTSEAISILCKDTKLDSKQIYRLSLCVEEMTVNVFKHGFPKDNKKHTVMIRIVIEDNKTALTLIDDCKAFDITKKLKSWELDKDHPEKNIGIRMIMLMAKEIHYSNTVNINNLQVIL